MGLVVTVSNANASVNPGLVNVKTAAVVQDDLEHGVPPAKYLQCRVSRDWPSGKSSRFQGDKFTGCCFAPFFDSLMNDRRHIEMRGCRYAAPPLSSTGSVVCRPYSYSIAVNNEPR